MTSKFKGALLAGASGLAVAFVMTAQPAQAFDKVDWTWNADVTQRVRANVDINIALDPTGLAMVEDLQVSIGDLTARSVVNGVNNNQPNTGGTGPQVVDLGILEFTGTRDLQSGEVTSTGIATDVANESTFSNGTVNTLGDGVTMNFDLGTITVAAQPGTGSFNALSDLPEVISAATAVANNTSIQADTSVQLHEGQFAMGSSNVSDSDANSLGELGVVLANGDVNSNLIGAALIGTGALTGAIKPAAISAVSSVANVLNASVDSAATAVANNLTVTVEAVGDDRALIADVVQVAIADVSATSSVSNLNVNSYTNLGRLDAPMVSSVASALGNNKSITVRAPVVVVTP
ncbi:hypothetical protein [Oceanibaculum pacificum]|uniref:Uncharacterized protein n=1 Tax=Oceanibaculum pacificum TaxID=580166 RepID=A0A154W5E6_9PROT|nr:hypothetical protein [Oceanibaculum pacificum]KZD08760.1 hypothetical protein AUP43_08340 [Oceanibaculum pacificum]